MHVLNGKGSSPERERGQQEELEKPLLSAQHRRILYVLGTTTTKVTINAMIIVAEEPLKPQPANITYSRVAPGAFNASGCTSLPKSSSRGF